MSKPTVNYPRNGSYPDQRRRRKQNDVCCDFNSSYAKSLQGICKAISMIVGLLVIIIIGVSPYFRTIFVIGGVTWPFHIVMLFTVCVWLATMFVYFFFLSGQHLQYPHVPWPKWNAFSRWLLEKSFPECVIMVVLQTIVLFIECVVMEFIFNVVMSGAVLFAAILEAANVWRWDMSMGMQFNPGSSGSPYNQQLSGLGYQQGMTMTQSINFNSYCTRYPKDCTDYFGLLTGHNSYLGNHIFATVLLFLLLICYLVSTYFSFRTWRVFVRDMVREGEHPKPTSWDRFKFRISEIKMPKKTDISGRFAKLFHRGDGSNADNDDHGNNIEFDEYPMSEKSVSVPMSDRSSVVKKPDYASSSRSSGHKSRSSHHTTSSERRSRSSSNPRSHKDGRSSHHGSSRDDRGSSRDHGSSRRGEGRHSDERSHRSGSEPRSNGRRRSDKGSTKKPPKDRIIEDERLIVELPPSEPESSQPLDPVASMVV